MKKFFAAFTVANIIAFAKFCAKMIFEIVVNLVVISAVEGAATFVVGLMLTPFGLQSLAGLVVFIAFYYKGIYRKLRALCSEWIVQPVYAFLASPRGFFQAAFA
jgi:hypothetical protein